MPTLALVLFTACTSPGHEAATPSAGPPSPVRYRLPEGSVVMLAPATSTPPDADDCAFADALLREALRQSLRFDFGAGVEAPRDPEFTVEFHHDVAQRHWSSTLRRAGEAPVALAAAAGEVPAVLDTLAVATRQALGERVTATPRPAAAIYSADELCVDLTEQARRAAATGRRQRAIDLLRRARARDSGCTITLAALASNLVSVAGGLRDARRLQEAERIAREGLQLEHRLAPTTAHRLAHALLIGRTQNRTRVIDTFKELLALGDVALRERPHDPHALHSRAIALNYLGRYAESIGALQRLARRWPSNPEIGYHLCFAELANGHPHRALAAIRGVRDTLGQQSTVVPTALALYHCDLHAELAAFLDDLADDPTYRRSAELHEIRRMQISHALLTDSAKEATRLILEDIEWIRQRPSALERLALDVVEVGEVMVAIGAAEQLRQPLAAFEEIADLPPVFAEAMVFLGGLIEVSRTHERATAAEADLDKSGRAVWSSVLRAAAHRHRGELQDELRERLREYQSTEMPLVRAALARVCRAAGLQEQAEAAIAELRARLLAFDLLRLRDHPLMSPAAALAFLITKGPRVQRSAGRAPR